MGGKKEKKGGETEDQMEHLKPKRKKVCLIRNREKEKN